MEDVEQQVCRLEQHEPPQHVAIPESGEEAAQRLMGPGHWLENAPRDERERQSGDGEEREHSAPAETEGDGPRDHDGSRHVPDRACDRPARHVALARLRVAVHQRRLRQAHERPGRRVADH